MDFSAMIRLATRMLGQREQIESALRVLAMLRGAFDTSDQEREPPQQPDDDKPQYKEGSVEWLQHSLNVLNDAGLKVDGDYGPATKEAVTNYQKEHGLKVDGWAGPETVGSILNQLDKKQ